MKRYLSSAAFIVAVGFPIAVVAYDGSPDSVKERRELMQLMAHEMDEIAKHIATSRDLAAIGENAMKVRQAGERMLELFPAGSSTGAAVAGPDIRDRWDRLRAKTRDLVQAAEALEKVEASADPRALSARYVAVRRVCGECHVLFRRGQ